MNHALLHIDAESFDADAVTRSLMADAPSQSSRHETEATLRLALKRAEQQLHALLLENEDILLENLGKSSSNNASVGSIVNSAQRLQSQLGQVDRSVVAHINSLRSLIVRSKRLLSAHALTKNMVRVSFVVGRLQEIEATPENDHRIAQLFGELLPLVRDTQLGKVQLVSKQLESVWPMHHALLDRIRSRACDATDRLHHSDLAAALQRAQYLGELKSTVSFSLKFAIDGFRQTLASCFSGFESSASATPAEASAQWWRSLDQTLGYLYRVFARLWCIERGVLAKRDSTTGQTLLDILHSALMDQQAPAHVAGTSDQQGGGAGARARNGSTAGPGTISRTVVSSAVAGGLSSPVDLLAAPGLFSHGWGLVVDMWRARIQDSVANTSLDHSQLLIKQFPRLAQLLGGVAVKIKRSFGQKPPVQWDGTPLDLQAELAPLLESIRPVETIFQARSVAMLVRAPFTPCCGHIVHVIMYLR